jgi:hypothetical protein
MSLTNACQGLKKHLNKDMGACRKHAFALVLDEEGLEAIERWSVRGLGVLAGIQVSASDRPFHAIDGAGGWILQLATGEYGSLIGHLAGTGALDVITNDTHVSMAHAGSRGWLVLAPKLRLQHRGMATEPMMECLRQRGKPAAITGKVERLFWTKIGPNPEYPFLCQEQIWSEGQDKLDHRDPPIHIQPKAEIAYAVSDAARLVELF